MSNVKENNVTKALVTTYSGRIVDLFDPQPESFVLEDIVQSLGNMCRFGGGIETFFSVAEHSIMVANRLPEELRLAGLLHDAAEVYVQDLTTPVKYNIGPEYREMEARINSAIEKAFDVDFSDPRIKEADNAQFLWEWEMLKISKKVNGRTPAVARAAFMAYYETLTEDRGARETVATGDTIGNSDLA